MREKFVRQAAERGVKPQVIDAVFAAFQPFERYGFNKAHATCYGLIAYQTAYLKANYTVDYMTSVLTAFRDNEEKVAAAVAECRRLGHRRPAARRPPLVRRVHGRGRRHPVRPAGGQERRRRGDRVDHRGPRGRRRLPLAGRLLRPRRSAAGQQARPRVAGQGRGDEPVRASRPSCSQALDDALGRRPGGPARPDQRPDGALRHGLVAGGAGAAAAAGPRGALARAAALGEGAARAVPVRASARGPVGADRPVRDARTPATSRTSRSTASAW